MRNFVFNEAMKLRRKTIVKMAQLYLNGRLKEELPKLNKLLLPGPNPTYRESLYHEREVLKQRIKLYLGLDYEKTKEMELYEIAENMEEIIGNEEYRAKDKFVQVIKEACDSCPSGKYYATDLCRNCVAHSCQAVCPKGAISFDGQRAKIDSALCVGCGLCEKACNYYAIVKLERPCEKACYPHALKSDQNGAAEIDGEKCVSCAACYTACPFGAVETPSQLIGVIQELKRETKINAMFAPAITAQFGPKVTPGQIKAALLKSGFSKVFEVAKGADAVAEEEAEFIDSSSEMVTTSCCPAFVEYIEKHKKEFEENISPAPSPMVEVAKHDNPAGEKIVFIGPCIAKKSEAYKSGNVDYVITFEEAAALFIAKGIEPSSFEALEVEGSRAGWRFAASGGVTAAVKAKSKKEIKSIAMNGLCDAEAVFNSVKKEKFDLIEGMACQGGCICGPGIMTNPKVAAALLNK